MIQVQFWFLDLATLRVSWSLCVPSRPREATYVYCFAAFFLSSFCLGGAHCELLLLAHTPVSNYAAVVFLCHLRPGLRPSHCWMIVRDMLDSSFHKRFSSWVCFLVVTTLSCVQFPRTCDLILGREWVGVWNREGVRVWESPSLSRTSPLDPWNPGFPPLVYASHLVSV